MNPTTIRFPEGNRPNSTSLNNTNPSSNLDHSLQQYSERENRNTSMSQSGSGHQSSINQNGNIHSKDSSVGDNVVLTSLSSSGEWDPISSNGKRRSSQSTSGINGSITNSNNNSSNNNNNFINIGTSGRGLGLDTSAAKEPMAVSLHNPLKTSASLYANSTLNSNRNILSRKSSSLTNGGSNIGVSTSRNSNSSSNNNAIKTNQQPTAASRESILSLSQSSIKNEVVLMEGMLNKKTVRSWVERYFVLKGHHLYCHKRKDEVADLNNMRLYVLVPGCYVTEVIEAKLGRKDMYVIRLHWPEGATNFGNRLRNIVQDEGTSPNPNPNPNPNTNSLDEEDDDDEYDENGLANRAKNITTHSKRLKTRAAEIEINELNQSNLMKKGATIAGVTIVGVCLGAATAGLALLPYLHVLGASAVATGGGLAYVRTQNSSSKLYLASDSLDEALNWKAALELQIAVCEGRRPPIPKEVNLQHIHKWTSFSRWKKSKAIHGLRIMEEELSMTTSADKLSNSLTSHKAQLLIYTTPIKVFLAVMKFEYNRAWSRIAESVQIVKQIDDHTDVIQIRLHPIHPFRYEWLWRSRPRDFVLTRYWKLDDDGSYLICLNSCEEASCPPKKGCVRGTMSAMFTIAPRQDYAQWEEDISEALLTHVCQIDPKGSFLERWLYSFHYFSTHIVHTVLLVILDIKHSIEVASFIKRVSVAPKSPSKSEFRGQSNRNVVTPPYSPVSENDSSKGTPSSLASLRQRSDSRLKSFEIYSPMRRRERTTSKRSHKTRQLNTEDLLLTSASLRNVISAKEYEVHRLEVEIGRSGSARMVNYDLLKQLQLQLEEISKLKEEYRTLTGKDFHVENKDEKENDAEVPAEFSSPVRENNDSPNPYHLVDQPVDDDSVYRLIRHGSTIEVVRRDEPYVETKTVNTKRAFATVLGVQPIPSQSLNLRLTIVFSQTIVKTSDSVRPAHWESHAVSLNNLLVERTQQVERATKVIHVMFFIIVFLSALAFRQHVLVYYPILLAYTV